MITCPTCRTQLPDQTQICSGCGSDLSAVLAQTPVATATPPGAPSLEQPHVPTPVEPFAQPQLSRRPSDLGKLPMALALSGLTLLLAYVFGGFFDRVHDLVFERGWIPYATVGLFGWALAILIGKYRYLNTLSGALDAKLLSSPGVIRRGDVRAVLAKLDRDCLSRDVDPASVLVTRAERALRAFGAGRDIAAVADGLQVQADVDAADAESSYLLVRVFIWAIPILGFIGTVVGIGDAVGGFSAVVQNTNDVATLEDELRPALGGVTTGLSVAFDTTLLALLLSVPVMLFTSFCQKRACTSSDEIGQLDAVC